MSDRYIVSLPMQVEADTPEKAVEAFIEQVNSYGLRHWNYNLFKLDEEGEVTAERLTRRGVAEETPDGDTEDEPTTPDPEPSDEGGAPTSDGGDS